MANHNIDSDRERETRTETWNSPKGFRFWTVIGVVVLTIITGMNVFVSHRRRIELNDQVEQLANMMGIRLVNSSRKRRDIIASHDRRGAR